MATPSTYTLKPRPRRRWLRRIALSLVALVAVVVAGWAVHGWRAQKALAATLDGYRQAGEPIDRWQFELAAVPDELNAAVALAEAAATINAESAAWEKRSKFEEPPAFPLTPAEGAVYAGLATENRAALAGVRRAVALPEVDWKVRYDQTLVMGTLLPFLGKQRELANVLMFAAIAAHQNGDDAAAVRHVRDILFVARAVDRQPGLVPHLVATGISNLASETAARIAPGLRVGNVARAGDGGPAARAEVEALVRDLLDERAIDAADRMAVLAERMSLADAATALADGRMTSDDLFSRPRSKNRAWMGVLEFALRPTFYTDGRLLAEMATDSAAAASAPDYPSYLATPGAVRARQLKDTVNARRPLHLLAAILHPAFHRIAEQGYHGRASRRLAATSLACRLHALDHGGALPASLSALVPAYLPAVPIDPMTAGRPLGYRSVGDDPIVYGIGRNGKDDGGNDPDPALSRREYDAAHDEVRHLKRQPRRPVKVDEGPDAPSVPGE